MIIKRSHCAIPTTVSRYRYMTYAVYVHAYGIYTYTAVHDNYILGIGTRILLYKLCVSVFSKRFFIRF